MNDINSLLARLEEAEATARNCSRQASESVDNWNAAVVAKSQLEKVERALRRMKFERDQAKTARDEISARYGVFIERHAHEEDRAMKLSDLRKANIDRQQEWDPTNSITIEYKGNELAGEVGEACNLIKKLARERLGIRGSRASIIDLANELADVIICVDLIAMMYDINLEEAVRDKFNTTSDKYNLTVKIGEYKS